MDGVQPDQDVWADIQNQVGEQFQQCSSELVSLCYDPAARSFCGDDRERLRALRKNLARTRDVLTSLDARVGGLCSRHAQHEGALRHLRHLQDALRARAGGR